MKDSYRIYKNYLFLYKITKFKINNQSYIVKINNITYNFKKTEN